MYFLIFFFNVLDIHTSPNRWVQYFTSAENRHALPMFTSLLNTVCAYDPVGLGVPYNHLLFNDSMEPLVDAALQILIVTLDHDATSSVPEGEEVLHYHLAKLHLISLYIKGALLLKIFSNKCNKQSVSLVSAVLINKCCTIQSSCKT